MSVRILPLRLLLAGLLGAAALWPAQADTIDTAKASRTFTIGYRPDAAPFSSKAADGKPTGYSVQLCVEIANAVAKNAEIKDLKIRFSAVTAENRFTQLSGGKIDILCEGTSITIKRMATMDFTFETFVSGASLMLRADQKIANLNDLAGKKIGVLGKTTTADGLRATLKQRKINAAVVEFSNHDAGLAALEGKSVDAYFADRELLVGLQDRAKNPKSLAVADDYMTNEPYALALRLNDTRLKQIANLTLSRLYRSGRIGDIFRAAFPGREPSTMLKALYLLNGVRE
jgi:ABC-type amino acid transport substrate-binding protein